VQYSFDLWEGTSVSSISSWLRGQKDVTSLVRVGSISHDGGKLVVDCTVLGIAQGFFLFKTREYANAPFRQGYIRMDDDFDEKADSVWLDDAVDTKEG
jgi:hypothetical protein